MDESLLSDLMELWRSLIAQAFEYSRRADMTDKAASKVALRAAADANCRTAATLKTILDKHRHLITLQEVQDNAGQGNQ